MSLLTCGMKSGSGCSGDRFPIRLGVAHGPLPQGHHAQQHNAPRHRKRQAHQPRAAGVDTI